MHFTQFLNEFEGINVYYSTVYQLLSQAEVDSPPKIQKATRRDRTKAKYRLKHPEAAKTETEQTADLSLVHKYVSSILGTYHINNATGVIVDAWFAWQETLEGYYHVFYQILENYGIPYRFKTDNRTVFNYNSSNKKDDTMDVLTRLGYACKQLGTEIVITSVSQVKGMVERANQTFQGRLKQEFRIAQINDIETANDYLLNTFVPDFNENNNLVCFNNHTKCLVIEAFDKQRFITVDDEIYFMREIPKNVKYSPD
ncbi:hypothetical protein FC42_GL000765 [Lactobacillus iners DSM 13335]|uniref:Integrase catalytic domain-containing protein n=2 Tax=Lactobacillus iners TaxID=147802 RepID=C8PC78_9LACO|nr:hypothetical protein HMPREF0520_0698 [Lactobacillus iners DSM 13335]KRL58967.1 hypothetical protein FC42_GL000765 [Lactobacillus iners DSM 13335]